MYVHVYLRLFFRFLVPSGGVEEVYMHSSRIQLETKFVCDRSHFCLFVCHVHSCEACADARQVAEKTNE